MLRRVAALVHYLVQIVLSLYSAHKISFVFVTFTGVVIVNSQCQLPNCLSTSMSRYAFPILMVLWFGHCIQRRVGRMQSTAQLTPQQPSAQCLTSLVIQIFTPAIGNDFQVATTVLNTRQWDIVPSISFLTIIPHHAGMYAIGSFNKGEV